MDGTFNVLEAGIGALVFASLMAYGWGSVYSVTKVLGEDPCRTYQQTTGTAVVLLRYHAFVLGSYLAYGTRLLRNGVDRRDVAAATVAALCAAVGRRVGLFRAIVHSDHGMPPEVRADFRAHGPAWCEGRVSGARLLLAKYAIALPETVEQHDLMAAAEILGWRPAVGFTDFLRDLRVPGELPAWACAGRMGCGSGRRKATRTSTG